VEGGGEKGATVPMMSAKPVFKSDDTVSMKLNERGATSRQRRAALKRRLPSNRVKVA